MTNLFTSAMHEFMAQATPDMLQHNIIFLPAFVFLIWKPYATELRYGLGEPS